MHVGPIRANVKKLVIKGYNNNLTIKKNGIVVTNIFIISFE